MEALMGCGLKVLPHNHRHEVSERIAWCPREVAGASPSRGRNGNHRNRGIVRGFSLSVSAVASSLSSENQTLTESEEVQTRAPEKRNKVRVKFKLNKECAFGQGFVIVGDDPDLGLWDPSDGVPFSWSDGHVWTADLDLPCGKAIKYKFVLKEDDKTISWQPDPDRILETWDTDKTITVSEDWENPEFQNIIEEEHFTADLSDESYINPEFLLIVESSNQPIEEEGTDVSKQLGHNDHASTGDDIIKTTKDSDLICRKYDESQVLEPEAPALVPGLIPVLSDNTEAESLNREEKEDLAYRSSGSDADVLNVEKFKDEQVSVSLHSTCTKSGAPMVEKKLGFDGKEQLEILENDAQWGRRTLQKFLAVFGFSFHH